VHYSTIRTCRRRTPPLSRYAAPPSLPALAYRPNSYALLKLGELSAVALFEKDIHGQIILAWSYPIIDAALEPVLKAVRAILRR
jgi:hypothetical protein